MAQQIVYISDFTGNRPDYPGEGRWKLACYQTEKKRVVIKDKVRSSMKSGNFCVNLGVDHNETDQHHYERAFDAIAFIRNHLSNMPVGAKISSPDMTALVGEAGLIIGDVYYNKVAWRHERENGSLVINTIRSSVEGRVQTQGNNNNMILRFVNSLFVPVATAFTNFQQLFGVHINNQIDAVVDFEGSNEVFNEVAAQMSSDLGGDTDVDAINLEELLHSQYEYDANVDIVFFNGRAGPAVRDLHNRFKRFNQNTAAFYHLLTTIKNLIDNSDNNMNSWDPEHVSDIIKLILGANGKLRYVYKDMQDEGKFKMKQIRRENILKACHGCRGESSGVIGIIWTFFDISFKGSGTGLDDSDIEEDD